MFLFLYIQIKETYEDVFKSEELEDTPWFVLLGITIFISSNTVTAFRHFNTVIF